MIDTRTERLCTLAEAARSLPAVGGNHLHPSTLFRWIRDGVRGGVKLEHVRMGGRILTSPEALDRFMNSAAEAPSPRQSRVTGKPKTRNAKQRDAAIATARKRLEKAGVLKGAA